MNADTLEKRDEIAQTLMQAFDSIIAKNPALKRLLYYQYANGFAEKRADYLPEPEADEEPKSSSNFLFGMFYGAPELTTVNSTHMPKKGKDVTIAELNSFKQTLAKDAISIVRATHNYETTVPSELSYSIGDILLVMDKQAGGSNSWSIVRKVGLSTDLSRAAVFPLLYSQFKETHKLFKKGNMILKKKDTETEEILKQKELKKDYKSNVVVDYGHVIHLDTIATANKEVVTYAISHDKYPKVANIWNEVNEMGIIASKYVEEITGATKDQLVILIDQRSVEAEKKLRNFKVATKERKSDRVVIINDSNTPDTMRRRRSLNDETSPMLADKADRRKSRSLFVKAPERTSSSWMCNCCTIL